MMTLRVAVLAACASGAWVLGASTNIVVNGSFENATGIGQINAVDTSTLTGWRVAAGSIDLVEFCQASDGARSVDLTITNMGYKERVWEFTAVGTTTTLAFASLTNVLSGGAVVDNVRVTVVPAPAGGVSVLQMVP